jgi:hypothetical protein
MCTIKYQQKEMNAWSYRLENFDHLRYIDGVLTWSYKISVSITTLVQIEGELTSRITKSRGIN